MVGMQKGDDINQRSHTNPNQRSLHLHMVEMHQNCKLLWIAEVFDTTIREKAWHIF